MRSPLIFALAISLAAPILAQDPAPTPTPTPVPAETEPAEVAPTESGSADAAVADAAGKPDARRPLALGDRLAETTALPDIDGKLHRALDYRGKLTVVNFWSTTCPVMKGYEATMTSIIGDYRERGVEFLMINSNEQNNEITDREPESEDAKPYQRIRDYLQKRELERTVLVDHGAVVADMLDAKTTPDVFVFDKSGRLVYRGRIDDDPRGKKGDKATTFLRDALDATLAEQPIAVPETKPEGCSIKRAPKPKPAPVESDVDAEKKAPSADEPAVDRT